MSFEIKEKDLLGRIGKLKTKSASVETPLLFPVINPSIQPIPPRKLKETFGFQAVITNAYILKKRFQNKPLDMGLHKFLDFDGTVMTDSGAYQILVYGGVEVTQKEIVEYQEGIGSDIATILDIPTGWKVTKKQAQITVEETLRRAKAFFETKTRDDILWVGPVQGGRRITKVNVKLSVTFVEWSTDLLKIIQPGSSEALSTAHDVISRSLQLTSSDYLSNVAIIGEVSDPDAGPAVFVLKRALCTGNFEAAMSDAEEAVVKAEFEGHFSPSDLDTEPWEIWWPHDSNPTTTTTAGA